MKLFSAAVVATIVLAADPLVAADARQAAGRGDRNVSIGIGIPTSIDLHGSIGVGIGAAPDYRGSDEYGVTVLPLVDIRQTGFFFLKGASVNPNDGTASLGWNALNFTYSEGSKEKLRLSVGPLVRYSRGRDQDDNDALSGLGDIDGSAGFGGFFEASAGPWSAYLTAVLQDVGNDKNGVLVAFGTKYSIPVSDSFLVSAGLSSSWGDSDYMQGFFGITGNQAAQSGLAKFKARPGFKDIGVQIGASYAFAKNWSIEGQFGYQRLLGDAAKSPVVKNIGSRNQFRTLVGVVYRF